MIGMIAIRHTYPERDVFQPALKRSGLTRDRVRVPDRGYFVAFIGLRIPGNPFFRNT
jgi:hypothetical protein